MWNIKNIFSICKNVDRVARNRASINALNKKMSILVYKYEPRESENAIGLVWNIQNIIPFSNNVGWAGRDWLTNNG